MRTWHTVIAGLAGLLAACSSPADNDVASCERTAQEPLSALQETEIAEACAIQPVDQLTIHLAALPEAPEDAGGCEIALIFAAPNGYATPRVSFGVMTDEGRYSGTSAAVRDFLFTDRLTNSSEMVVSSSAACDEVALTVQELRCRDSAESGEAYQDCGPVEFKGTDMFAAFTPPGN